MTRKAYLPRTLVFIVLAAGLTAGQEENLADTKTTGNAPIRLGSLNEMAINLPEPSFPTSKRQPKYPGIIVVEADIDLQKGRIVSAKAITGFPGFRKYAEDAAFQASFPRKEMEGPPLIAKGTLIYRYPVRRKGNKRSPLKGLPIIIGGIVNAKAVELPKPFVPNYKGDAKVKVRVIIGMSGDVIDAWAVNGSPSLVKASEAAARLAKFTPLNYCCGPPIYVVAYLEYSFGSAATFQRSHPDVRD